jgi:hypothetical protein
MESVANTFPCPPIASCDVEGETIESWGEYYYNGNNNDNGNGNDKNNDHDDNSTQHNNGPTFSMTGSSVVETG